MIQTQVKCTVLFFLIFGKSRECDQITAERFREIVFDRNVATSVERRRQRRFED